jgi:signal transduction histidine kinase
MVGRHRIVLAIRDDGRGFDPSRRGDGIGLWTMQQRALLLGGTLTIDSAPGRGSVVAVEAPLRDNAASSAGDGISHEQGHRRR